MIFRLNLRQQLNGSNGFTGLWRMKKETLKELGKLHFDIAKIIIALVVIGGFLKEGTYKNIIVPSIFVIIGLIIMGSVLINKEVRDDNG